jgi:hypothetical protein
MTLRILRVGGVVALMAAATGCLSVKSYVDPQLPRVGYADLLARRDPRPVVLTVAFHLNGEPATGPAATARDAVRAVVDRSKLFPSVLDSATDDVDRLEIVLDNIGDMGEAAGKGALTGLTFGAAGSMVTDGYVFTATFRPVGKPAVTRVYRHAIHSTIGNTDGPPGLVAEESPRAAFDKVVEGLMLNLLLDLQKEEQL